MIYLHKLLPLLITPLMMCIVLCIIGLIFQTRFFIVVGLLLLYFFSMPLTAFYLVRNVEEYAVRLNFSQVPHAQAIVVLGGMLTAAPTRQGVVPEWSDPDRFLSGVELFKQGKGDRLILSGSVLPWQKQDMPEGEALKKFAVHMLGLNERDVVVTPPVTNTQDEAIEIRSLIPDATAPIILVTSAYHMPRAKIIFAQQGLNVFPYPVDFSANETRLTPMDFLPSAAALAKSTLSIREKMGQLFYRFKN